MKPNTRISAKSLRTVAAAAALTLSVSAASLSQDSHASKHYVLPATTENVQWGWYDINEKPKLTIKSGDTVSIETLPHSLGQIKPGVSCRDVAQAHDDYMRARGLPPETRLYAHGQGYDMVERPLIRADESMYFEEGMCLAVHPGYETPEIFAVICDNYMVGAQGPGECLHETEKKVFEIPV